MYQVVDVGLSMFGNCIVPVEWYRADDILPICTVGEDRKDNKLAMVVSEMNALNAMWIAVNMDGNNFDASYMLAAMTGGEEANNGGYGSQERAFNVLMDELWSFNKH